MNLYLYIYRCMYIFICTHAYMDIPLESTTKTTGFLKDIFSTPRLQVLEDGHLTDSKGRVVARFGRLSIGSYVDLTVKRWGGRGYAFC